MDKTIISVGIALIGLGIGFLVTKSIEPTLHGAFTTGGYLWLIVGAATSVFALKVKREKRLDVNTQKTGAI